MDDFQLSGTLGCIDVLIDIGNVVGGWKGWKRSTPRFKIVRNKLFFLASQSSVISDIVPIRTLIASTLNFGLPSDTQQVRVRVTMRLTTANSTTEI